MTANEAIELHPRVKVKNTELAPMLGFLVNDRASPSKDRAGRRSEVFDALCHCYGVDDIDALVGKFRTTTDASFVTGEHELALPRHVIDALKDFGDEALSAKGENGLAILTGIEQDRVKKLLKKLDGLKN
jgi:hypothetical protein